MKLGRLRAAFGAAVPWVPDHDGLAAAGLRVTLGGRRVLDDVMVTLGAGELVALVGANGSGKTTLLRALAGLVPLGAGEVRIARRPLATWPRDALARRLALLAQGGDVEWSMRVRDVVALGRLPHAAAWWSGARDAGSDAAVERAMARTGVTALADRPVTTLSGGERARVLLARALAVESPLLLADEPTASLDPMQQLEVMQTLHDLTRGDDGEGGGAGVLVVLHDLALAARFCDRVIVLVGGRVIIDASPQWALNDAVLATAFGITALRGEQDEQHWVLPWGRADRG
jgi:iron complex transport system ATP-binding protein